MEKSFKKHPDYPNGTPEFPFRKIFGYARVSTEDQDLNLQIQALEDFGCDKIFQEKKSATAKNRYQFNTMLSSMRKGDLIVVWKLDRLGRSVIDIHSVMKKMEDRGVDFKCITQPYDTTSFGRAMFGFMAVLAQLERDLISERTKAGMAVKKAQGVQFGKKSEVVGEKKLRILIDIWLCQESLPILQKRYNYKSHSIFQSYFPGERKAALAALSEGPKHYRDSFCGRVKVIAKEEGISLERALEIGKDMGVECDD